MKLLWWILTLIVELIWPRNPVINPIPSLPSSIPAAALDVAAMALELGVTEEQYRLSPAYQQALLAAKKKKDIDQIRETEQKAEAGDPEALKQMRENVS